jgi:hypothetical protein
MHTFRTLSVVAIVFAAQLSPLLSASQKAQVAPDNGSHFEQIITQKFNAVAIENPHGRTEVETWTGQGVKIVGDRQPGKPNQRSVEARLRFQITANDLRIVVRRDGAESPINLLVFVPRQIALSVKGEDDAVSVKGVVNGLTVETNSGPITLAIPKTQTCRFARLKEALPHNLRCGSSARLTLTVLTEEPGREERR